MAPFTGYERRGALIVAAIAVAATLVGIFVHRSSGGLTPEQQEALFKMNEVVFDTTPDSLKSGADDYHSSKKSKGKKGGKKRKGAKKSKQKPKAPESPANNPFDPI